MLKTSFAKLVDPISRVSSESVFLQKRENVSRRFLLELPRPTTTRASKLHAVLLGPAVPIILRQEFPRFSRVHAAVVLDPDMAIGIILYVGGILRRRAK